MEEHVRWWPIAEELLALGVPSPQWTANGSRSQELGAHAGPSHDGAHGSFQLSPQLLSGDCIQCAANLRQCSMYSRCSGVALGSKTNSPCIALLLACPSICILLLPQNGAYHVLAPLAARKQSQPNIPAASQRGWLSIFSADAVPISTARAALARSATITFCNMT
jgi:hypothetical protein